MEAFRKVPRFSCTQAALLWWLWSLETLLAVCFSEHRSQGTLLIESPTLWRAKGAELFLILLQRLFPLQNISSFTLKSRCWCYFNCPGNKKRRRKTTTRSLRIFIWRALKTPVSRARGRAERLWFFLSLLRSRIKAEEWYIMFFNP